MPLACGSNSRLASRVRVPFDGTSCEGRSVVVVLAILKS